MIAHSVQISEVVPETFVKIVLNNGKHRYGYLIKSDNKQTEIFNDLKIESFDPETVLSIDPFMK